MSAFIVDDTHIDALLTAGLILSRGNSGPLRWFDVDPATAEDDVHQEGAPWGPGLARWMTEHRQELRPETADRTGAMLMAANRDSVNYRYAEGEIETIYTFRMLRGTPQPVTVLSALSCFEYQSCEHPAWSGSEAQQFCEALRATCIRALPGYDQAPWEITDRGVFLRAAFA